MWQDKATQQRLLFGGLLQEVEGEKSMNNPGNVWLRGVWCCERRYQCKWQGFALHAGLAWGEIPSENNAWRQWHDRECGGQLIQLIQPNSFSDDGPKTHD